MGVAMAHITPMAQTATQKMVKRIRQDLGWTLTEMAEELGVNHSTVLRWENGERSMRESHKKLLAMIAEREGVRV